MLGQTHQLFSERLPFLFKNRLQLSYRNDKCAKMNYKKVIKSFKYTYVKIPLIKVKIMGETKEL